MLSELGVNERGDDLVAVVFRLDVDPDLLLVE